MKRLFSVFIFSAASMIALLFLPACPILEKLGETNTGFWVRRADNNQWYQVPSTLAYEGTYCQVYVEDANSYLVSSATAQNIANEFDNNIYNLMRTKFGTEPDVDANGKVVILVLDIKDGYSGSGGYVAGYFDPTHELDIQYSNMKDMLFMDCIPGLLDMSTFYLTIAHEFQHMINFNQKVFVQPAGTPQDTWINEGLSAGAETVYTTTNIAWKIEYYNDDSYSTIRYGQNFVSWGRGGYANDLGNYATVYLFFQWLRRQASNGDGVFKEILDNSFSDYRCVETVATNRLYSGNWRGFLRDWFIANLLNNLTGPYGYKGFITTTPKTINPNTNIELLPGEGVYSIIVGSYTITQSGNIDYLGMTTTTKDIDSNGNEYSGNRLLSFQFSGYAQGFGETTGKLPASIVPTKSDKIDMDSFSSSKIIKDLRSYPIDLLFEVDDLNGKMIEAASKKKRRSAPYLRKDGQP